MITFSYEFFHVLITETLFPISKSMFGTYKLRLITFKCCPIIIAK